MKAKKLSHHNFKLLFLKFLGLCWTCQTSFFEALTNIAEAQVYFYERIFKHSCRETCWELHCPSLFLTSFTLIYTQHFEIALLLIVVDRDLPEKNMKY